MVKNLPNSTSTKRHAGFKSSHHKSIISLFQEESMRPHTKAAASTAAKWALGLSAGFILGPIVIGLASGTELSGELIAEKIIVGIALIPILFFGLWAWGALSKKDPVTGVAIETNKGTTETPVAIQETGTLEDSTHSKANKWNYVGIGAGAFMLFFLFLPQFISGTLANLYYLGAAFWVGVIIYCSLNILRARQ